ncbi:glycosyltransferase [Arthrobacter sp. NPDC090010]|uniref:glycosyltransferase n=1 Tax=Arthrobacter sp. NPDC090010 TaxID=3363942 RepID=UPI003821FA46
MNRHVADLSVLASERESFGLAVQESLAHGVPAVVRRGTGAEEALGVGAAGAAVDLDGGADTLAGALAAWLEDPELAARWRKAALLRRWTLPRWTATAQTVLTLIRGRGPRYWLVPAPMCGPPRRKSTPWPAP